MTKLSKNFTLSEFTRSATAIRLGFREQFSPSQKVIFNLTALCSHVLQPLRDKLGQSIFVSSGFRCDRLNSYVKGATNSQHSAGEAADIVATGKMSNTDLFDAIIALGLPFDQLIWEFGDNEEAAWIHVSYGPRNRRQILRASRLGNRTVYTPIEKHPVINA